jgi:solute carrier family 45 protein 1/2/4
MDMYLTRFSTYLDSQNVEKLIGNSAFYGVEMSYVNVYLLSLGMSKSLLSFVWIAGPLSGLTMQPIIGVLADSSTSKYGRRRPIMLVGSVIVSLGLCTMAWAKEITAIFNFEEQKVRLNYSIYSGLVSY